MPNTASQARSSTRAIHAVAIGHGAIHHGAERRGARLRTQIETMRLGGMSPTAIRRALGLSAEQAVAAGVISPETRKNSTAGACGQDAGGPAAARSSPRLSPRPSPVPGRGPAMIEVLRAVARASGVPAERLLGSGQDRALVRPRQLVMHLLRAHCAGASLPAIGHLLGRDHTTVLYGCRRAADLLARDAGYRELRARALRALNGAPAQSDFEQYPP